MAWCYVKKKKTMFSVHFYVLIGRFLGVKTLEKNPTGQQVTGLSSLARTECIPVAPLTQWHVVLLLEVGLCGFCQLPYKASIHPSLLTGTLISGLTWEEQDWHFLPPLLLTTFPADTRHRVSSTRSEGRWEKEKKLCLETLRRPRQTVWLLRVRFSQSFVNSNVYDHQRRSPSVVV